MSQESQDVHIVGRSIDLRLHTVLIIYWLLNGKDSKRQVSSDFEFYKQTKKHFQNTQEIKENAF